MACIVDENRRMTGHLASDLEIGTDHGLRAQSRFLVGDQSMTSHAR